MSIILLIRHGENDTLGKYLAGRQAGVHLNAAGQRQAKRIVTVLKEMPIDAIYSSPLERALETATPLANARNLEIQLQPGLLELDYGRWQGLTFEELRKLKEWEALIENPELTQFPAGESMQAAQQRISKQIDAISIAHQEFEVAACFTHNDVIRLAVAHYLNMPLHDLHRLALSTASITAFYFNARTPRMMCFNLTGQLKWKAPAKDQTKKL